MNNKIKITSLANINYEKYPFIAFNAKKLLKAPSKTDIDEFLNTVKLILDNTEGPFIFYINYQNITWVPKKTLDYFGVSYQVLESQYLDRHKGNFIYSPNVTSFLMSKIIAGFITPKVPIFTFFNKRKAESKAHLKLKGIY